MQHMSGTTVFFCSFFKESFILGTGNIFDHRIEDEYEIISGYGEFIEEEEGNSSIFGYKELGIQFICFRGCSDRCSSSKIGPNIDIGPLLPPGF